MDWSNSNGLRRPCRPGGTPKSDPQDKSYWVRWTKEDKQDSAEAFVERKRACVGDGVRRIASANGRPMGGDVDNGKDREAGVGPQSMLPLDG